jgi:Hypervirulence associated proteins TUDOR domain
MPKTFKRGDHVEWNSEAGRVRGVILKKVISEVRFKGYVHHASRAEPQYFIASDKTDHIAIHKGAALRLLDPLPRRRSKDSRKKIKRRAQRRGHRP